MFCILNVISPTCRHRFLRSPLPRQKVTMPEQTQPVNQSETLPCTLGDDGITMFTFDLLPGNTRRKIYDYYIPQRFEFVGPRNTRNGRWSDHPLLVAKQILIRRCDFAKWILQQDWNDPSNAVLNYIREDLRAKFIRLKEKYEMPNFKIAAPGQSESPCIIMNTVMQLSSILTIPKNMVEEAKMTFVNVASRELKEYRYYISYFAASFIIENNKEELEALGN